MELDRVFRFSLLVRKLTLERVFSPLQEAGCLDQWTIQIFVEYAAAFTTSLDLLGLFLIPIFTAKSSTWLKSSFMVLMVALYSSMPILGHTYARTILKVELSSKTKLAYHHKHHLGLKISHDRIYGYDV